MYIYSVQESIHRCRASFLVDAVSCEILDKTSDDQYPQSDDPHVVIVSQSVAAELNS
jgi:hypothetical protein